MIHLIAPPENNFHVQPGYPTGDGNRYPLSFGWKLTDLQQKNAIDAAEHLGQAFSWVSSAEGYAFWKTVHNRLIALSEGEDLQ